MGFTNFWAQVLISFTPTLAFSIILNVPKRAWLPCALTGTVGWLCQYYIYLWLHSLVISNFIAAILIGICYLIFSRKLKIPVIILNVPAIVPLVPGYACFLFVRYAVEGDFIASLDQLMKIGKIGIAIVFGFMFVNLFEQQIRKQHADHLFLKQLRRFVNK